MESYVPHYSLNKTASQIMVLRCTVQISPHNYTYSCNYTFITYCYNPCLEQWNLLCACFLRSIREKLVCIFNGEFIQSQSRLESNCCMNIIPLTLLKYITYEMGEHGWKDRFKTHTSDHPFSIALNLALAPFFPCGCRYTESQLTVDIISCVSTRHQSI